MDVFFANAAYKYAYSNLGSIIPRLDESYEVNSHGNILLRDSLFNIALVKEHGIETYLRGAMANRCARTSVHYIDDLRNLLPKGVGYDILAISIQRTRDLNFPTYNEVRKEFLLPEAVEWSDITNNKDLQNTLQSLYKSIDKVESFIGALAEDHSNGAYGDIIKLSITEQFKRTRDGDPFFYQNPGVLSDADLASLGNMSLGRLISYNTEIESLPENPFFVVKPQVEDRGTDAAIRFSSDLTFKSIIFDNNQTIQFTVTSYFTWWFGFGFGETMNDLEAFLFRKINGEWDAKYSYRFVGVLRDIFSNGHAVVSIVPDDEEPKILDFIEITPQGQELPRIFQFSRKLSVQPPYQGIVDKLLPMCFSGTNSSAFPAYHDVRGVIRVNLKSGSSLGSSISVSTTPTFLFHGLSMAGNFGIFIPMGMYIAKYHPDNKHWLIIHEFLMAVVLSNVSPLFLFFRS